MMGASEVVMIIVALIGVIGSVATNILMNSKSQAITETKLENLIAEVKKHNEFAVRIPQMETKIQYLEEMVKDIKSRAGK